MITDCQGNCLSNASAGAADLFDAAVRSFNICCGDPLARLDEAIANSPAFAQAHLLKGFILALATEPAATRTARQVANGIGNMRLNDRAASQSAIFEQFGEALDLYDRPIHANRSRVALDLVDASALLWRLHLCGVDVGDRWPELASCWDEHADGRLYAFNDLHAAMALAHERTAVKPHSLVNRELLHRAMRLPLPIPTAHKGVDSHH